jgi:transposase InsO family protein
MKSIYPSVSLGRLCWLLGLSRQAYYQNGWALSDLSVEQQLIVDQVQEIRKTHPVIGGRKLYFMLQPLLLENQIKVGRDALFDLLSARKLLVRRRRRRVNTTQSTHWFKKYPNLVKHWHPSGPNQLWVADITYVPTFEGFLYLSLITDAYSHKIMGYCMASNLEAVHTTKALEGALEECTEKDNLIHHSDRGFQYCSSQYVDLLNQHRIKISMTEGGDPLDNAVAERINGIIKNEYLAHCEITNTESAVALLDNIVHRYNQERPHQSINMLTPQLVHENNLLVNRTWGRKQQLLHCKPISGLP